MFGGGFAFSISVSSPVIPVGGRTLSKGRDGNTRVAGVIYLLELEIKGTEPMWTERRVVIVYVCKKNK